MTKPFLIQPAKSKPVKAGEALDVAARHFLYKLYDASRDSSASWQSVRRLGEVAATVSRATELGWIVVRDEGKGRAREVFAALTEPGRVVARKALR